MLFQYYIEFFNALCVLQGLRDGSPLIAPQGFPCVIKKGLIMIQLLIFTLTALLISLLFSRKKTSAGMKMGLKMFMNLLPPFLTVLIAVSFVLAMLPREVLEKLLGADSGIGGFFIAAGLGSIALIPGFIAFPLSAVLLKNGVSYPVISVFITTLMMVGVVTLPIEKKYFGWKVAIARNGLSFIGALITGAGMALLWGLV